MKPTDWSSGVEGTLATRNTPRSGSSASRSVNVPPTSPPICHAIRYSSPSCRGSRSLTLSVLQILLRERRRLLQVHPAVIDRRRAGRRTLVLHEEDGPAGRRAHFMLEMRVGHIG